MKIEKITRITSGILLCSFFILLIFTNRELLIDFLIEKSIGSTVIISVINIITLLFIILVTFIVCRHYIFQKKRMLAAYYRQAFVVAAFIMVIFMRIFFSFFSKVFSKVIIKITENGTDNLTAKLWGYNIGFIIFIIASCLFFMVFFALTKCKTDYICMITKKIKEIEENGFGNTVEVIGEDELAELCRSINHMSKELYDKEIKEKDIERRKNELITNISHDLRSPLASVIGYVGLLKQERVTEEQYKEYINVIERRLYGLNAMANELFELVKLDSPGSGLNYEETDICVLLKHMASEYTILFSQRGLYLKTGILEEKCIVNADVAQFARAVQNLLDNAGKYTADGIVNINTYIESTCRGKVIFISVSNKVKDVAKIKLDSLFERFYKGDTARGDIESSGLGLAITKKIIELHGGRISADINGENIYFIVEMPVFK